MKIRHYIFIFLGMTMAGRAVSVEPPRVERTGDIEVGRVDAVHPAESRLIVEDRNYMIGKRSRLLGLNGIPVSLRALEPGLMVKIKRSRSRHGNTYVVETLRVITDYQADTILKSMKEEME